MEHLKAYLRTKLQKELTKTEHEIMSGRLDGLLSQLSEVDTKRNSTMNQYLLSRIERSLNGQKKIERHIQDYLYIYRHCKMED